MAFQSSSRQQRLVIRWSKTTATTAIAAAGTGPSSAIASTSAAKEPEIRTWRNSTLNASATTAITSRLVASGVWGTTVPAQTTARSATTRLT